MRFLIDAGLYGAVVRCCDHTDAGSDSHIGGSAEAPS